MSPVTIFEYEPPVVGADHRIYRARACGRQRGDGLWEGWIEFEAFDGMDGLVRRTARETTQPNRADLVYWATGLTSVFLEGALERAIASEVPRPLAHAPAPPAFDGPADADDASAAVAGEDVDELEEEERVVAAPPVDSIVDPYVAYAKGEHYLRNKLGALEAWHLRNVARANHIVTSASTLDALGKAALIELIVAHVRGAAAGSPPPPT
jgi:hypothetical protein